VYRTEVPGFGFGDRFDPVGETSPLAIGLYSQLLLRTLVTYRHVAGVAGTKVVPDIATDTGRVSSDGLTWTFTLKEGVNYAPPLNRSVAAEDVANAFRRIDTASLQPQYGMWFDGLIVGMDGARKKAPSQISGIETPNDHTIVFHLRHPAGDFPDRLALPATAPVPREVASCYHHAGWYGRTLVASGPYFIEGEDELQQPFSSCLGLAHPVRGFDLARHLRLVRNPNYDPATDSPDVRSNYLDGVDIEIQADPARTLRGVSTGRLDGMLTDPFYPLGNVGRSVRPPNVHVQEFAGSGGLRYLFMNLLVPPFDDVHVRRAVEFAVDRKLVVSSGARWLSTSRAATHLFRSPILSTDAGYDPYPHDLAAAKAEMARSRYDHNHDGTCDDVVCRNVFFLPCPLPPDNSLLAPIASGFASIGIKLEARELDVDVGCLEAPENPKNLLPVGFVSGWAPDFPDPIGLAVRLTSAGISCDEQTNYSEVGMTRAQMRQCRLLPIPPAFRGHPARPIPRPPSADADVARCEALSNNARNACWDAFDHHMMEDIVPWLPLYWTGNDVVITGRTVVSRTVTVDQFSGLISLAHLIVNNNAPMPG